MGRKLKALIMALVLTLTTVVSFNGSDIRTKAKDTSDELSVVFHFTKDDNNYANYYMWIWTIGDGVDVPMVNNGTEATVTLNSTSTVAINSSTTTINYIVKDGPSWDGVTKDVDADRSIDVSSYVSGQIDIYLVSGQATPTVDDSKASKGFKLASASTEDLTNISIKAGSSLPAGADLQTFFKVKDTVGNTYVDISNVKDDGSNGFTITTATPLDAMGSYQVEYGDGMSFMIGMPDVYVSKDFEDAYTYNGDDLGATWSADSTTFKVWAPLASDVSVNLYKSGNPGADDLIQSIPMNLDKNGTWVLKVDGDQNGVYYTYSADVRGKKVETIDPYARTSGVNGQRGMVIDLSSTNPEGWDGDTNPCKTPVYQDDVLYELHIRDFSYDASSGVSEANRGKYLAFTEQGTKNSFGQSTGIDYLKDLGITHVHLLPTYDYASIDETDLATDHFNWGYDPQNYNLPEGSYSTDPYNGATRVKEFKQMVKSLHDNGIGVVMDVVYGHVNSADNFSINQLTPSYYSRKNSNGSGCGNDTATERLMNRKFIVDSMVYWAKEYHINGFRIDQVGLFDTDTVNALTEALHEVDPNIVLYGEGWSMTTNTSKDVLLASQANADVTPGFAYFNDGFRDSVKGGVFDTLPGYVTRGKASVGKVIDNVDASTSSLWAFSPDQVIQYNSCHDNYTLFDRIAISNPKDSFEMRVAENNLAGAMLYTAQGVPFMQAGEEILRTKVKEDGTFDGNSYNAPSAENAIKWDTLNDSNYSQTYEYYKGLIELRKAHPAFRMTSYDDIYNNWTKILDGSNENQAIAYELAAGANGDSAEGIIVVYNPSLKIQEVTLPEGNWDIYVNGQKAGTTVLGTVSGTVNVDAISAMVLIKQPSNAVVDPSNPANGNSDLVNATGSSESQSAAQSDNTPANQSVKTGDSYLAVAMTVLALIICASVLVVLRKRKEN
ncbi:MAG: type I pullulanase [Lachnospiraceae bacterium]|nr:type I pullulanase [Lachnospiraceae bacterium]